MEAELSIKRTLSADLDKSTMELSQHLWSCIKIYKQWIIVSMPCLKNEVVIKPKTAMCNKGIHINQHLALPETFNTNLSKRNQREIVMLC
jgi:hypothetical protein